MRELQICECIGKRKLKSKKTGKDFYISYCVYDYDGDPECGEGQSCFQVFEDLSVGERYSFISSNGFYQIIKE